MPTKSPPTTTSSSKGRPKGRRGSPQAGITARTIAARTIRLRPPRTGEPDDDRLPRVVAMGGIRGRHDPFAQQESLYPFRDGMVWVGRRHLRFLRSALVSGAGADAGQHDVAQRAGRRTRRRSGGAVLALLPRYVGG